MAANHTCQLQVPILDPLSKIGEAINMLEAEKESNEEVNQNIILMAGVYAIQQVSGVDTLSLAEIGSALLQMEIAASRVTTLLKALREQYIRKHEDLELLINGRMPGSLLAGLDAQVECAHPGTPDNINHIHCQQNYYDISCQIDGIDVTKGFSANPLIPVPYYQDKETLEVDFPDNSFYVPGSGNIIEVDGCA